MSLPRPIVAAFDFDVTMTTRDTLRLFLLDTFGRPRITAECARLWPEFARFAVGQGNRDRLKARLLYPLFADRSCAPLVAMGEQFAQHCLTLLRPAALARLRNYQKAGNRCVMVSASLDLYLVPVAAALGFDDLLCTRLEREGDHFTGRMVDGNCRAQNKVIRLTELLGDLGQYELHAYGDSAGDKEMLAAADRPYFRALEGKVLAPS